MRVETVHRPARPVVTPPVVAVPQGWAEPAGVDPGRELGPGVTLRTFQEADLADSSAALCDVVGLMSSQHRVSADVMDRMPGLRVISVDGTGVWDQVDVGAATARGVAVCNVRDYAADAVAEFTLGALIVLARGIPAAVSSVRDGMWEPASFVGSELHGRTLGLVGLGSIGTRVAQLARAFGMRVLCSTAHPDAHASAEPKVEFVSLPDLLRRCDVLSLHARLDETTRGLLGGAELELLRPGALLVNTARAGLVEESALVAAVRSGRLAGAALDVTDPEPLPAGSPLRGLDTVMITPHIASSTTRARRDAAAGSLRNIASFLAGAPTSVVNPEVLQQP